MADESWVPDFQTVFDELRKVRDVGLIGLRRLRPRALTEVARRAGLVATVDAEPAAIEDLLRRAVQIFGGGTAQEIAEYTFGLTADYRMRPAGDRRQRAAQLYGVKPDSFRKEPERLVIEQMAEGVMAVAREAALRQTRIAMEQRHPADSRLAVQWVERFEAYYRIWTPVSGLANDLKAAVDFYRDEPAHHLPWDPDSEEAFDPVDYAETYMTFALCHYASFQLELSRFISRHGGLWLLSDADAEQQVASAVYRIQWHNGLIQDDDAWLRRHLADSRHEERDHFIHLLATTSMGTRIHQKWQATGRDCECEDIENGDGPECQLHGMIRACKDYMDLIDNDWMKIADWYRPGSQPRRTIDPIKMYETHVTALQKKRQTAEQGEALSDQP